MTREHGPFRNMGDFKAVALDYNFWLSNDTEGQLYCLSDRDIYVLLTMVEAYVGWWTRWYNTEDTSRAEIRALQSELMEKLMSCVDISVLVDQGKLNLTRSVQQQQIESQGLRDIYQDRYDGSPTSINPNAPTTNFGSTGDRYDALCAALMAFIYQFANYQIQALVAGDVAAFALLAGAALLLIPGLNLFYIAGASLALALGGGIIGVSTSVAIAALSDTDALDTVVCYMRDQLKALSVTEANFASVLNSYPFPSGSNEAIVADFLKGTLTSNYLGFLDMLGQAYSGLINDQPVPACPCAPETICVNFVSFVSDGNWSSPTGAFVYSQHFGGHGWGLSHGGMSISDPVTNTTFWVEPNDSYNGITYLKLTFSAAVSNVVIKSNYASGGTVIATSATTGTVHEFFGLSGITNSISVWIAPGDMANGVYLEEACRSI